MAGCWYGSVKLEIDVKFTPPATTEMGFKASITESLNAS
jgi:hypothetical protein